MALEINDQFDFFKNVQLDNDGNLLVSIINFSGGSSFDSGGTMNGDLIVNGDLTVTGNTILAGLTAGTIDSDSILWENKEQNNINGLIAGKGSDVSNSLDVQASIAIGGLGGMNPISMSDVDNAGVIASKNADIRNKSNESIIVSSRATIIANTQNTLVASSDSITIGQDTGSSSGKRNSVISSSNSTIITTNPGLYKVNNSSIIASNGITINSSSILERVVVIGMDNYTTSAPGVHVDNLYIRSGATTNYVWTSADSTGRGEWRANTSSINYYTTGATLNGTTLVFDRNDELSAYTVDLSVFSASTDIDGGDANASYTYEIDGGDAYAPVFNDYGQYIPEIGIGQTSYTFAQPSNVLSISILTGSTSVILPDVPYESFFVVKDKTGNAGTYPITVSCAAYTINGESDYIINLGTKPSITFLFDGTEYITI